MPAKLQKQIASYFKITGKDVRHIEKDVTKLISSALTVLVNNSSSSFPAIATQLRQLDLKRLSSLLRAKISNELSLETILELLSICGKDITVCSFTGHQKKEKQRIKTLMSKLEYQQLQKPTPNIGATLTPETLKQLTSWVNSAVLPLPSLPVSTPALSLASLGPSQGFGLSFAASGFMSHPASSLSAAPYFPSSSSISSPYSSSATALESKAFKSGVSAALSFPFAPSRVPSTSSASSAFLNPFSSPKTLEIYLDFSTEKPIFNVQYPNKLTKIRVDMTEVLQRNPSPTEAEAIADCVLRPGCDPDKPFVKALIKLIAESKLLAQPPLKYPPAYFLKLKLLNALADPSKYCLIDGFLSCIRCSKLSIEEWKFILKFFNSEQLESFIFRTGIAAKNNFIEHLLNDPERQEVLVQSFLATQPSTASLKKFYRTFKNRLSATALGLIDEAMEEDQDELAPVQESLTTAIASLQASSSMSAAPRSSGGKIGIKRKIRDEENETDEQTEAQEGEAGSKDAVSKIAASQSGYGSIFYLSNIKKARNGGKEPQATPFSSSAFPTSPLSPLSGES